MTPLTRAFLLAALACGPAWAAKDPVIAPSKSTMEPMAGGTMTGDPPAPANPPLTKAQVLRSQQFVTLQMNAAGERTGLSTYSLNLKGVETADEGHKILEGMAEYIRVNAKTDEYKTVGGNTVAAISKSIGSDEDFKSIKSELEKLPEMLKSQLSTSEFEATHNMKNLTAEETRQHDALIAHYNDLMGMKPAVEPARNANPDLTTSPDVPKTEHGAMDVANEGKTSDAHPPFMKEFHNDWLAETKNWTSQNPPSPTPPSPAPDPTPNGGTGSSPSGDTGVASPGNNAGVPSIPPGYPPIQHINDMISASPSDSSSWQMRAGYKLDSGDYRGAVSDAEKALSLGGGIDSRLTLGEAQLSMGDKPSAHEQATAALELDPKNKRAMALAHFSEGYASVAAPKAPSFGGSADAGGVPGAGGASALALLNSGPPLSAAELRRQTENALRLNDLPAALAFADRALAQDPDNAAMLNLRAAIHARMHDYDKAAADAKAGLALAPRNATLLKTLAYAQVRGKHSKEALASANELLALNRNDPYAFALRAHAEGDMGERDAMMADINRAAAIDPRYAATAAELAKIVQLPSDQDVLFLFPGEEAAPSAKTAARGAGRGRSFGLLVGASALGGLLLALGLLAAVLAPLKERVTSAFTRITRSGPAVAAANDTAQPASVNGLMPGLIRGQYEISRQIGAGGMGMVFAGTDRSLGRPVAIKKMRDELRINPQERARFVIEAKTVAALHHPNIVDIYAIAEEGPDVFLIFEFVDGKTAHELVQTAGRLTLAESARIVRAAADALGYAHARGVIHRDMKPSNVMLDSSGRVKVMDFGIARMAKDSMTRYSMTNTVVGTPPYMAPEQEQGLVRKESDVYALAICAYEMMTGKLPFIGIGAGMLMNKINMSYVSPSHAIAGMPEALDEVFTKAFQADPDKRYRTPKEFADALESALPSAVRA